MSVGGGFLAVIIDAPDYRKVDGRGNAPEGV